MSRTEYMKQLNEALKEFDQELVSEIVSDYEERFSTAAEEGKSEEEVIGELGSVEQLVEELKSLCGGSAQEEGKREQRAREEGKREQEAREERKRAWSEEGMSDSVMRSIRDALNSAGRVMDAAMREAGEALDSLGSDFRRRTRRRREEENAFEYDGFEYDGDVFVSYSADDEEGQTEEYEIEPGCRAICVEGGIAQLSAEPSKDGRFRIRCEYASRKTQLMYPFYYYQKEGCLYAGIRQEKGEEYKSGFFRRAFNGQEEIHIAVETPGSLEKLLLRTSIGEIGVREVKTRELAAKSSIGTLEMVGCRASDLNLKSRSGDVHVNDTEAAQWLVQAFSGDLRLEGCRGTSLQAQNTSGDMVVHGLEAKECRLTNSNGRLEISDVKAASIHVQSVNGDIIAEKLEGKECRLRTVSGDVGLKDGQGERLAAETAHGNIQVGALFQNYVLHSTNGDLELVTKDADIVAGTVNGDIGISVTDSRAKYRRKIKTVCGSCKIVQENQSREDETGDVPERTIELSNVYGNIQLIFH